MEDAKLLLFWASAIACGAMIGYAMVHGFPPQDINDLRCEGRGITIDTTMTELRKPGPYVVGIQPDGDTIAVAKDGLRCQRID